MSGVQGIPGAESFGLPEKPSSPVRPIIRFSCIRPTFITSLTRGTS